MTRHGSQFGRRGGLGTSSNLSFVAGHLRRAPIADAAPERQPSKPTRCHRCGNVPKFANLLNPTDDGRYECRARKACDDRGPDPMLGWNPDPDDLTALPKGATR